MRHELSGQVFGRLTVIGRSRPGKWECRCECGGTAHPSATLLLDGSTRSCGCLARELSSRRNRTHGMSKTKEFGSWQGMINRCKRAKHRDYPRYGGRGIRVCDRWSASFEDFFRDMGPAPSSRHSIDRIDGDGNYEPGNCRWATPREQARNRHNNKKLEYEGKTMTAGELAELAGVNPSTVRTRLKKQGTTVADAIKVPAAARLISHDGRSLTIKGWAEFSGIPQGTIVNRICTLKWDPVRAITTPSAGQSGAKSGRKTGRD